MVWFIKYKWPKTEWVGCDKKNDEEIDKDFIKEEFWLLKGMSDINNRAGARKEKGLTRKEHEQGFIVGMQKQ